MRFLLDMPVSVLLLRVLDAHGHEGVHAHQIGQDRATDRELVEIAAVAIHESSTNTRMGRRPWAQDTGGKGSPSLYLPVSAPLR